MDETHNTYVNGKVNVCVRKCDTCIFRPGNLMHLEPGRVEGMIERADRNESCIPCHHTLDQGQQAVCKGYFVRNSSMSLRVARMMDLIRYVEPDDTGTDLGIETVKGYSEPDLVYGARKRWTVKYRTSSGDRYGEMHYYDKVKQVVRVMTKGGRSPSLQSLCSIRGTIARTDIIDVYPNEGDSRGSGTQEVN